MPGQVEETSLTDAVTKAVQTEDTRIPQDLSETQEVPETQETPQAPQTSQEDLETEQGRQLIQALKDPQKAVQIIDFLAQSAGYTRQQVQEAPPKEVQKDINKILETHLGDEFKFLAPKLAPAIREALDTLISEHPAAQETSNLRARLERQELRDIQAETSAAHVSLSREFFGSDDMPQNVINAMSVAMDEFPPTDPNMAPDKYYRKIFSLVAGELGLQKRRGGTGSESRVSQNRSDSAVRNLDSQSRGVSPSRDNPRKMGLKDAVSLAVEQVNQASGRK